MLKRAVVFANGELADLSHLKLKKTDLLVGVDGGTKHIFQLGLKPDVIIGDMDSLKLKPKNIPLIKYPVDKDLTDTELALNYCCQQKVGEIILVGFLGQRLDHLISNLLACSQLKSKVRIVEANQELFFVRNKINLKAKKGQLVSLIPLSSPVKGITTSGLKWPLKNDRLKFGSGKGISNVVLKKNIRISLTHGCLLVVKHG